MDSKGLLPWGRNLSGDKPELSQTLGCSQVDIEMLLPWGQTRAARVPSGQSGLGKSTMVNTLFKSKVSRKSSQPGQEERIPKTVQLQSITHGKVTTTGSCPTSPWDKQGTGLGV